MRLWRPEPATGVAVRGRLEHVRSGRAVTFHGPDELIDHLVALALELHTPADSMPARNEPAME